MRLALAIHPDFRSNAVRGLKAEVSRTARGLALRYEASGAASRLLLPAPATPARTNELWKHTCFEFFVSDGAGYREFNFAPSTQWAAYRFSGYREGMTALETPAPRIESSASAGQYEMRVELEGDLPVGAAFALTAVIEEMDGAKSFWSLRHPDGGPDFHHADNFAARLPASET